MARTAPEELARSSRTQLLEAHDHCSRLLSASRSLAVAAGHDPDVAVCKDAGCLLDGVDGDGRLCSTAHRLGGIAGDPAAPMPIDLALRRFLDALGEAVDAIRTCRQTAHPSGYCWFSGVPGADGCGAVLQLAHRVS